VTRETWLEDLAHELTSLGVGQEQVASIVVEADNHLAETAEAPLEAFGSPARYALQLAAALDHARPARPPGPVRVRAHEVSRRDRLPALSLEVRGGEAVVLVGPNGSGKSTFLRILAGLTRADAGEVEIDGTVGYAPQQGGLVSHLRPWEHFVLFGHARGLSRAAAVRAGRMLAEQLGWDALRAPMAGELSGGTQQKLNVVLAALGEPDVLLLDEPYQGLDRDTMRRFWELLWSWRDAGRAVLVVSHALDAVERADVVVEL
jgi:ABC-type multidrug transport system ATPase subunit